MHTAWQLAAGCSWLGKLSFMIWQLDREFWGSACPMGMLPAVDNWLPVLVDAGRGSRSAARLATNFPIEKMSYNMLKNKYLNSMKFSKNLILIFPCG